MSHHIYKTLRAITGRYGMELRRTCGSSGLVTPQTDIDLLDALHTNKGNLPRSVHGTVIIKGADRYWIIWKSTSNSEKRFTFTYYSPPKDGGSFLMPQVCVHTFPVLPEMTFLKMVAILVVDTLNQSSSSRRYGSIATGPLSFELSNLVSARQSLSSSPPDQKIARLIIEFNAFNKYSMVCYPVGMHYDHFHHNKESIENKLLLCCPCQRGSHGQDGSISGNMFVYALLDW